MREQRFGQRKVFPNGVGHGPQITRDVCDVQLLRCTADRRSRQTIDVNGAS